MDIKEINVLVLAFLGDTIYENYVRKHLILKGVSHVNDLQKQTVNYVSAKNQASYLQELQEKNLLTEEEEGIIKRARNHKNHSHPKNCDIITYKLATGLEALIGYLDLKGNHERIEEIMKVILK